MPLLLLAACGGQEPTVRNIGEQGSPATGTGGTAGTGTALGSSATQPEAVACEPVGDASTADRTVVVRLGEWSVQPAERGLEAPGRITFTAENSGKEPHELVIVRASNPDALPLDQEGAVAEEQLPPEALVGEIEAFPPGTNCQGTFDLPVGDYVLLCNLVDRHGGEEHVHYRLGMRSQLRVGAGS